ncbi:MAG: CDP-glucose 4,6-dehydratase [bacterium]
MVFEIYKNKKVFLTGHTGFKGSWLTLWLKSLGAEVLGYSLEPNTNPSMFEELKIDSQIQNVFGNILDREKLKQVMADFAPDMVFHLAAQPIVRLSYSEPVLTYETNVIGTLNVLEAARNCSSIKAFVNVTTDKCYENKEIDRGYYEDEPMGGHDMYSSSKGCVEIMSSSYRRSFLSNSYAMATARAGNVIGGGDWAIDRLIPDCIRYINQNQPIEIRNPVAVRPWQHVLEPLSGYLLLGKVLLEQGQKFAEGFNFGPYDESVLTVAEVAKQVVENYEKGEVVVQKRDALHEANLLMLNIDKVQKLLGWKPVFSAKEAIKTTVDWYKEFYNGNLNMLEFTFGQIEAYQEKIDYKGVKSETITSTIS